MSSVDTVFRQLRDTEKACVCCRPGAGYRGRTRLPRKIAADRLGWDTSFDLGNSDERAQVQLPVLLYHEQLDSLSRKIASAAKTAMENPARTCCTSCSDSWSGMSPMTQSSRTWPHSSFCR